MLGCGDFVESVLRRADADRPARLRNVSEVLAEVSREWGITEEEILGPTRQRRVSGARREFYRRAHEQTGETMAELGRLTGRTQASVWEAIRKAEGSGRKG